MSVFKRGNIWWYRFRWNSEEIRESTKQTNKRTAEQMEAAHKTALAKGEVGLREKKKAPVLRDFIEDRFLPFVEQHSMDKTRTRLHYRDACRVILSSPLALMRLDEIRAEDVAGFLKFLADYRIGRAGDASVDAKAYEKSSINRKLSVLRRIFKLTSEWEVTDRTLPKVTLLKGENQRERVLSYEEEAAYLAAARAEGDAILSEYEAAKAGIRATQRGEVPIEPTDPYRLYHLALILIDCGLRPDEAYRLRWDGDVKDGELHIPGGKTKNARRIIPVTDRVKAVLRWRQQQFPGQWVFPAPTKSGHIEQSTLRDRHARANKAAGVATFVPYDLRHTRLTRWAKTMDAFTLMYLAGHGDIATTRRYVHIQADTAREAIAKAHEEENRHKSGHSAAKEEKAWREGDPVIN